MDKKASTGVFDLKLFNNLEMKISKDDLAEILVVRAEEKLRADIKAVRKEAAKIETEVENKTKVINKFINDRLQFKINKVIEIVKKAETLIKPLSYKSTQNTLGTYEPKFNINNWEGLVKKDMKIVSKKISYILNLNSITIIPNLNLKPVEIPIRKEIKDYANFRGVMYKALNNLYNKLHDLNTELADIGFKRRVLRARLIEDSLASSGSGRDVLKLLNSSTK